MEIKALLIEDQRPEIFRDVLDQYNGFSWTVADDGRDGIEKALATRFDVIICDLRLPFLDGFEVMLTIRANQHGPNAKTPIIAISAFTDAGTRAKVKESGGSYFFPKPLNFFELYRKIFITVVEEKARRASLDSRIVGGSLTHQQHVIESLTTRLNVLEEQRARFGNHTPAHIVIEIEQLKKDLQKIKENSRG